MTWFKYDPMFTSGASRLLDFSGSGTIGGSGTTCNSVYLKTGEYYVFQLRWWDYGLGLTRILICCCIRLPDLFRIPWGCLMA